MNRRGQNKKANSRLDFVFKNNICSKSKTSQVTIFIILGLLLVVIIAILFVVFRGAGIKVSVADEENPQQYIESCVKERVEEAVELLMKQGGYLEPTNFKTYKDEKISYLCYNRNYLQPCVNQEPILIKHLEEEIENYIDRKVDSCFDGLKLGLEKKNYEVVMETGKELEVNLISSKIFINIEKDFKMSKKESEEFKKFKFSLNHPIYNLADIAREIVNQEIRFGGFQTQGYNIFYPGYEITMKQRDDDEFDETKDDTRIYIIKDKITQLKFQFAIRNFAPKHGI